MYELTYESTAKKKLTSAGIKKILKTSRANNSEQDITGCLVYYNNKFIQILEGDKQAVQSLFEKIKVDKRHQNVRLIAENASEERTFPQWGMAFFPIDEKDIGKNEFEQFKRNLKLLADFSRPTTVTSILFWKKIKLLVDEQPGTDE